MLKATVEAHATHNTLYSIRNNAKDKPTVSTYPCCVYFDAGCVLEDDENGIPHRVQNIELLVITAVATDRSTDDRDAAIEAAEKAALEILVAFRETYAEWIETRAVRITTQADQYTVLETGVLCVFQVRELQGLCLDSPPGELPSPTQQGYRLDDLLDVDATTPADGDIIVYDEGSGRWILGQQTGGGASLDTTTTPGYITIPNALGAGVTGYVPILDSAP